MRGECVDFPAPLSRLACLLARLALRCVARRVLGGCYWIGRGYAVFEYVKCGRCCVIGGPFQDLEVWGARAGWMSWGG